MALTSGKTPVWSWLDAQDVREGTQLSSLEGQACSSWSDTRFHFPSLEQPSGALPAVPQAASPGRASKHGLVPRFPSPGAHWLPRVFGPASWGLRVTGTRYTGSRSNRKWLTSKSFPAGPIHPALAGWILSFDLLCLLTVTVAAPPASGVCPVFSTQAIPLCRPLSV